MFTSGNQLPAKCFTIKRARNANMRCARKRKGVGEWRRSPHTPDEILALFRDKPLDFEPGSKWAYSNSNYEVLGAIIERVSGTKYGDLLRQRILDPLGMKDTGLDSD